MKSKNKATAFAILAAALYAVNIPLSKLFLNHVDTTMMASFLYLGAGVGLLLCGFAEKLSGKEEKENRLTRKELPFTVAMVILDIAAPILLMLGIARTASANVSLLNNFEIVATSIISFFIFREVISRRLWFAILLITAASVILSFEGDSALAFNEGSLFVLGACICWGVENNCTRMISNKSSVEIVTIKGLFSGTGSFLIALFLGEQLPEGKWIAAAMLLGFVAYGLSIDFYIRAQKDLGAAKTSAYYSIAPFLGVFFGMLLLSERPGFQFYFALAIMIFSTVLLIRDSIRLQHTHTHVHVHTHEHRHGELVHTHEHSHAHEHLHVHGENAGQHEHIHDVLNDHNHKHEENEYGK